MPNPPPLEYGAFYHIYNRGTNGEDLFPEDRNYSYFLDRYAHYVEPVAETYAYCLLKNHFHVLIRTRVPEEQEAYWSTARHEKSPFRLASPSRQLGRLFSSYAMAINAALRRSGSLFDHPFHRKRVATDAYYRRLVVYIDRNAQHHGFVDDFREWTYSSYGAICSAAPTRLERDIVLEWFGGAEAFADAHATEPDGEDLSAYVLE